MMCIHSRKRACVDVFMKHNARCNVCKMSKVSKPEHVMLRNTEEY